MNLTEQKIPERLRAEAGNFNPEQRTNQEDEINQQSEQSHEV